MGGLRFVLGDSPHYGPHNLSPGGRRGRTAPAGNSTRDS